MASTLVGVSSLDELSKGFENFPLSPTLFFLKFILELRQKSKIFSILLVSPMATITGWGRDNIPRIKVVRVWIEVRISLEFSVGFRLTFLVEEIHFNLIITSTGDIPNYKVSVSFRTKIAKKKSNLRIKSCSFFDKSTEGNNNFKNISTKSELIFTFFLSTWSYLFFHRLFSTYSSLWARSSSLYQLVKLNHLLSSTKYSIISKSLSLRDS